MPKVKMSCRHTHPSGRKLEKGFVYDFPIPYAEELVKHGLAVRVIDARPTPVLTPETPGFAAVQVKPPAAKRFRPRGKVKK